VTRKQDNAKGRSTAEELKRVLAEDRDLLKTIVEETLQKVLEAEMDKTLQASKSEHTISRLRYRAAYYKWTLMTKVGHIDLRVPQDRQGRFCTEPSDASVGQRPSSSNQCCRMQKTNYRAWSLGGLVMLNYLHA
jgi:hypothetical protein